MNKLAQQLIKLGHTNPELRDHIRPLLDKIAAEDRVIAAAEVTLDERMVTPAVERLHDAVDKFIRGSRLSEEPDLYYGTDNQSRGTPEYYVYLDYTGDLQDDMLQLARLVQRIAAEEAGLGEVEVDIGSLDSSIGVPIDLSFSEDTPDLTDAVKQVIRDLHDNESRDVTLKLQAEGDSIRVQFYFHPPRGGTNNYGSLTTYIDLEWNGSEVRIKPRDLALYEPQGRTARPRNVRLKHLPLGIVGHSSQDQFARKYPSAMLANLLNIEST